jgi:3-methyladenine DNA glycosylase AlkD
MMKKFLQEVHFEISHLPNQEKPTAFQGFHYVGAGKSKLTFLDIKLPLLRTRLKQGFSFSNKTSAEQIKIWDYIWKNTNIFEVMLLPLMWLKLSPRDEILLHRDIVLNWLNRSDNWAISDSLSDFYALYLEQDRKAMLPILNSWKASKNPWVRRQSLVSLMYYSRLRNHILPFKEIQVFLVFHLSDDHYFVQKGLGWAIREAYNVYPKETLLFLNKHVKNITSVAWIAASEKLPKSTKTKLMLVRKEKL